ncbi:MAG: M1 family metallopeptidase [Solirubrobacteraceae bacterium]
MRRTIWAMAVAVSMALAGAPAAAAAGFGPGSAGLGDPFFPLAGNGGYDVSDYALTLGYDPAMRRLDGHAVITATATQDLSRFDLDLRGFTVSALTVNGWAASFTRDGQELVITPAQGVKSGGALSVVVDYAGVPDVITDPDGSIEGFVPTSDGAFVVGEPQGSPGWYPANDNPRDKATFSITVTVPAGLTAVSNGLLTKPPATSGGQTTFAWRESRPMAPYLATATLGRFEVTEGRTPGGVPTYVAVDPKLASPSQSVLSKLPDIVDYYSSVFGPYPFEDAGAIVDDAPNVGYSLESQTKPNFDRAPDEATLAHELSHQWFGDAVTLRAWPDIWLHEGFATFAEWLWREHTGQKSVAQRFKELYSTRASDTSFWSPPPGAPGDAAHLFDGTIYDRGGMTLEALREKVGDGAFFGILRDWYTQNRYGTIDTPGFIALAEQVSGQDLGHFFDVWLYQPGKPTSW